MAGFSLTSILNSKTLSQATDSHKVKYIDRNKIFPSPYNKEVYTTDNIELLSYGIEDDGLLEPIIVVLKEKFDTPDDNTYYIISGHRRMLAIEMLVERNPDKERDFQRIPCIIKESTSKNNELLLSGNIYNRNKTDAERAKELSEKKKMLLKRKQNGEKISGRLLELIAKEMDISLHQAKKFNSINTNATETVKEAFSEGKISTETAYELSKAKPEKQDEIISKSTDDEPLTAKKVKVKLTESHERPYPKEEFTETNNSTDDDLPYGKQLTDNESPASENNVTTHKNPSLPAPTENEKKEVKEYSKLDALSDITRLLKIFATSDENITITEDEIISIKASLNKLYEFVDRKQVV